MAKRAQKRKKNSKRNPSTTDERLVAMTKAIQQNSENVKKLAAMIGQQEAKIGVLAGSADGLDNNVLALAEMMKEVFGQLTQFDELLKILDFRKDGKPLDELIDVELVKKQATSWYQDILKDSFQKVHKRMEEHRAQQLAQKAEKERLEKQKAEEVEKAVTDTKERETMEAERQTIESNPLAQSSVSEQSPIPEGAHVFGG